MEGNNNPRPPNIGPPGNNIPAGNAIRSNVAAQPPVNNNNTTPPPPVNNNTSKVQPVGVNTSKVQPVGVAKEVEQLAQEVQQERSPFAYTQRAFWGKPTSDYTILAILACLPFTGFFGLDHVYMRSPKTALLKAIGNIFTLGLWYFYDMAQVLGEKEQVKEIGYSFPALGPMGIGAGIFPKTDKEKIAGPTPTRFIIYTILMFIPFTFGADFLVAGDYTGFLLKLLTYGVPIFWIFGLFWAIYTFYCLFFDTEDVISRGPARFLPWTLFVSEYGCSKGYLGPERECTGLEESSLRNTILKTIWANLGGLPVVGPYIDMSYKITEAAATGADIAGKTVGIVVDTVVPAVVGVAKTTFQTGKEIVSTVPRVASDMISTATSFTDPETLKRAAIEQAAAEAPGFKSVQKGGGGGGPKPQDQPKSPFGVASIVVVLAGVLSSGVLLAKLKTMEAVNLLPSFMQRVIRSPAVSGSDVPPTESGPSDLPPN